MMRIMIVALMAVLCPTVPVRAAGELYNQTPPTILQVFTPKLNVEDMAYGFEIAFTTQKSPRGAHLLRAAVTVTKSGDGIAARWRDIVVTVAPEATRFTVVVDGRRFVLEAKYVETPTYEGAPPREIVTSFGQMFAGGRIGVGAMLES